MTYIAGKFSNGTGCLEFLLAKETSLLNWDDYYLMAAPQRLVWEDKTADLAKAILLLVNSKNELARNDLYLAYAQGNLKAYPGGCEKIARFLLSQYANKKTNNPDNNN